MTYVKEIIDVESFLKTINGVSHTAIRIKFSRCEFDRKFTMDLIKNSNGDWVKHVLNVERQNERKKTVEEQLKELEKSKYQAGWDVVIRELLVHPKVRMHTLY